MSVIEEKLFLLDRVYKFFDDFVESKYKMACAKGCAACCTRHVTGTTLEAYRLLKRLRRSGRDDFSVRLDQAAGAGIFRPGLTANALAMACMSRHEPPVEKPGSDQGPCPLLKDEICPVYEDRPFGCRGMLSKTRCRPGGQGEVPSELVSVVMICDQIIEHLDVGGSYGNMIDLLLVLTDEKKAFQYTEGEGLIIPGCSPTRTVPGFLVPPEDEAAVQDFIDKLFQLDCDGRTFRQKMSHVRDTPF